MLGKRRSFVWVEVLCLFALSLTPLLWFRTGHIVLGLDSGYPIDYIGYFFQRTYTWLGSQNFGIDMTFDIGSVFYNALPAVIQALGVGYFDVQKVLFVGWFAAIVFSIYSLLFYLYPQREQWISRWTGTIMYALSFHLYSFWLQGEQFILASYVLLPLTTLLLLRFIREKKDIFPTAVLLNAAYLGLSSGGIHGAVFLGPIFIITVLIAIYFAFVRSSESLWSYVRRLFMLLVVSLVLAVCFNAYYLFPFIATSQDFGRQVAASGGLSGIVGWTDVVSKNTSFANLMRLGGDNSWYSPQLWSYAFVTNPVLILYSFIFPVLAFLAPLLVKKYKEKNILPLFLIITLIGLFLSAGTHPPTGFLYAYMMQHIPGFAIYRSAYYKFMPLVYLSYSVLMGLSVYELSERLRPRLKTLCQVIFIVSLLAYHYPYFQGSNFDSNMPFTTMIRVPDYVYDFSRVMKSIEGQDRTLIVPPASNIYDFKAYAWGYWGLNPIFPTLTDRGTVQNDSSAVNEYESTYIGSLYAAMRNQDVDSFRTAAGFAGIRYVLLTRDIAKDFYLSLSEDPEIYRSLLENRDLFSLKWENGPWKLYEIVGNKSEKISVSPSVSLSKSDPSVVSALFYTKKLPFVTNTAASSIPVSMVDAEFNRYPCTSCGIIEDDSEPARNAARVKPNSPLYMYKLRWEERSGSLKSADDPLYRMLGLSTKRLAEIETAKTETKIPEVGWIEAARLLKTYWKDIRGIYEDSLKDSVNYGTLWKMTKYADYEYSFLSGFLELRVLETNPEAFGLLRETLGEIAPLRSALHDKLLTTDWSTVLEYDVSNYAGQLYFYPYSLPKGLDGKPLYPIIYSVGTKNNEIKNVRGQNISIPEAKQKNTAYFTFSLPNLLLNSTLKKETWDQVTKNCIASPIHGYSGISAYVIQADLQPGVEGTVYIKRRYDLMKTADYAPRKKTFLDADMEIPVSLQNTGKLLNLFRGKANDSGADIYFCTPYPVAPTQLFSDIRITEWSKPLLYSSKSVSDPRSKSVPEIKYSRITATTYRVTVQHATAPFVLSFAERYSPQWRARYDDNSQARHLEVNGFENGWYIDRTGTYDMIISFSSQQFFVIGIIVSALSISIVMVYCAVRFMRRTHHVR